MSTNLVGQTLLKRYRVEAFIAVNMSQVYLVRDIDRNVPLIMKVLSNDLAEDPSILKLLLREGNALKKLKHPNIPPFYGVYKTSNFVFLLEHFVDGPTLKDLLRKRKGHTISVNEALIYLKALNAALGYAHVNGVVHCDIKPGNVMVDQGGHIYLTDFGIVRHAESTTTTLAGAGTPAYMAPEQIRGEAVTPATDVYGLGVMLFEMLTGRRPFRGVEEGSESAGPTMGERIRYEQWMLPPPDPRLLNPDIPEGLASVILTALAKNPSMRFENSQAFFSACCNTLGIDSIDVPDRTTHPIENNLLEPMPSSSKWKRRVMAFISGVIIVMIIVLAVWWGLQDDNDVLVTMTTLTNDNQPFSITSSQTISPESLILHTMPSVSIKSSSSVNGIKSETPQLPTQTHLIPTKTDNKPIPSSISINTTFTAKENMMCRRGPNTYYEHAYDVLKGETYPVIARWNNNWLLLQINNPRVTTSTRCCWVGGNGYLNENLTKIQLIDYWVEEMRQTCEIK